MGLPWAPPGCCSWPIPSTGSLGRATWSFFFGPAPAHPQVTGGRRLCLLRDTNSSPRSVTLHGGLKMVLSAEHKSTLTGKRGIREVVREDRPGGNLHPKFGLSVEHRVGEHQVSEQIQHRPHFHCKLLFSISISISIRLRKFGHSSLGSRLGSRPLST